jgi:hypothetical protein
MDRADDQANRQMLFSVESHAHAAVLWRDESRPTEFAILQAVSTQLAKKTVPKQYPTSLGEPTIVGEHGRHASTFPD